jgi:hypothetical protein
MVARADIPWLLSGCVLVTIAIGDFMATIYALGNIWLDGPRSATFSSCDIARMCWATANGLGVLMISVPLTPLVCIDKMAVWHDLHRSRPRLFWCNVAITLSVIFAALLTSPIAPTCTKSPINTVIQIAAAGAVLWGVIQLGTC